MARDSINIGQKPYKLGIALSGGGARGIAHAGVLKALEEAGLKPEIIAGVSAGSAVGVLYAGGVKPDDILNLFLDATFSDFTEFTFGKGGGFFRIDKFADHICRAIGDYKNLEDLPIPVYVGVTNFEEGIPEEFHTGPIKDIVKASCSIPIALTPVEINGTTYVDGGVLRNLPAWIIRDKCEKLIGSNVSPLRREKTSLSSMFDVATRAYSLLAKSNQAQDIRKCDFNITLAEISHCKVFSLKDAKMIFTSGYANARKRLRDAKWWKQDIQ